MNTLFANLKTFETNSKVLSKTEDSRSSFKVGSGRFGFVFISGNLGRFETKKVYLIRFVWDCNMKLIFNLSV